MAPAGCALTTYAMQRYAAASEGEEHWASLVLKFDDERRSDLNRRRPGPVLRVLAGDRAVMSNALADAAQRLCTSNSSFPALAMLHFMTIFCNFLKKNQSLRTLRLPQQWYNAAVVQRSWEAAASNDKLVAQ